MFFTDTKFRLFQIYQDQQTPKFEKALLKTKKYLLKIRDLSHSFDAKTIIVIIPLCFEIDQLEWEERGFGDLYSDDFF
jgi:hypothetical protein